MCCGVVISVCSATSLLGLDVFLGSHDDIFEVERVLKGWISVIFTNRLKSCSNVRGKLA